MDTIQLHCFVTAAKYESITKASEELFIPQPTISKQIHKLESELGNQLFSRHGKHIILNENGKIVLKYAKKFECLVEDLKKELIDQNDYTEGSVSLLVTSCSKLLPDILQKFRKLYPNIKLYINQSDTCNCEADLELFSQNDSINCENCIQLFREDICLAVPFGHSLALNKSISLNDLKNERFIMLKPESNLRKAVTPIFKKYGFNPNIVMEAENPSLLRELISSNFGISIMPSITWGNASDMQVKLISFKEAGFGRTIYLSWNSDRYLSRSANQLRSFIQNYFKNIQTP
ncbi:MAG: LysR family transcriptional regulator [Clostridia bacterium]|jgi:DNA-binding transcriptional LysR family regulator|nr:LysR family transcriptional regulator [Clostridia bacterium]MCI1999787.1 LysR family transcriptional regulator [Clostridia bacterium]MCI2014297.1 LysR family transcriptional regulator [Clostridia bacterium]